MTKFFHTGITVSNIDLAREFFCEVFGLEPTSEREISGPYLAHMLSFDEEMTARIVMLRTSDETYIELVEYKTPSERLPDAKRAAVITKDGTPHFAFFVEDLDSFHDAFCGKYLFALAARSDAIPGGPYAGGRIRFYRSSFGCMIEIIERPK